MDTTVVFIVIKSHILFNSKIFTNCIFCCSKSQPLTPKGSLNAAQQMVLGYTLTLPALCRSFYTTLLITVLGQPIPPPLSSLQLFLLPGSCVLVFVPTQAFIMALYCGLRTSNNLANFFCVCVAEQDLCNPGWPQSSEHGLLRLHTALVLAGGCDQAAQEATVYRLLNHISIQGQTFCSQKIFLLLLFSSFESSFFTNYCSISLLHFEQNSTIPPSQSPDQQLLVLQPPSPTIV